MFTVRVGRPETIGGGEEPDVADNKEVSQWKLHPGSEASDKEEEEEEEYGQELSYNEAGQEALGSGSGQLNQIIEGISALASSIALL